MFHIMAVVLDPDGCSALCVRSASCTAYPGCFLGIHVRATDGYEPFYWESHVVKGEMPSGTNHCR